MPSDLSLSKYVDVHAIETRIALIGCGRTYNSDFAQNASSDIELLIKAAEELETEAATKIEELEEQVRDAEKERDDEEEAHAETLTLLRAEKSRAIVLERDLGNALAKIRQLEEGARANDSGDWIKRADAEAAKAARLQDQIDTIAARAAAAETRVAVLEAQLAQSALPAQPPRKTREARTDPTIPLDFSAIAEVKPEEKPKRKPRARKAA